MEPMEIPTRERVQSIHQQMLYAMQASNGLQQRDRFWEDEFRPELKGSIAEGPNHSNFSARHSVHNSVRI